MSKDYWHIAEEWEKDEILHHSMMRGGPLEGVTPNDFYEAWNNAKVFISNDNVFGKVIFDNTPYKFILQELPQ